MSCFPRYQSPLTRWLSTTKSRSNSPTRGSYFAVCGFSKGYFGIQELGSGKKVAIFSVWEPGKQNNPNATPEQRRVKAIASGDGVRVKRFGGEGTGGQSFYDYDWKVGESVRFAVFAKSDGQDRTQYAGYIYVPEEHRWQHMATFSTLANGHLLRGYYSFVEDFRRDGESARIVHRANYGNGWIKVNADWQAHVAAAHASSVYRRQYTHNRTSIPAPSVIAFSYRRVATPRTRTRS